MFGEWLPQGRAGHDDDGSRGLFFIAFNASIERQFGCQQQWMNFGATSCWERQGSLIGNREGNDKLIIGEMGTGIPLGYIDAADVCRHAWR
jgi:hypothetical protein